MPMTPADWVRIGMLAVIRDTQEWMEVHPLDHLSARQISGHLLTQLVIAAAYHDGYEDLGSDEDL